MVARKEIDPHDRPDRYRVSVEQYRNFREKGFLVVKGLVAQDEIDELRRHTEDLMQGRLPEQTRQMPERDITSDGGVTIQQLEAPPAHLSPIEKAQHFLRIHMLHRKLALHERYLLHPRVLDVLEVLIGPDISAMQTMLFLKPPGKPGQGWHQDSYYIPTFPDTLCGAWIAIDECDETNGAMWFAQGSQVEPIYPPAMGAGTGDRLIGDITYVKGVSNVNDEENDLAKVADRYPQVLVPAKPGDVVFFGGHVLHRSKANHTADRFRRAFVSHYSNARSFTQWGVDEACGYVAGGEQGMANNCQILARGDTHLPFATPRFGTPCAATQTPEQRTAFRERVMRYIAEMQTGMMGQDEAAPDRKHDHASANSGY